MRRAKTAKMRRRLRLAARKIKELRLKAPYDGYMQSIFYGDLEGNRDHWQVELIHDKRCHKEPYIAVYRWIKPKTMAAIPANEYLLGTLGGEVL